MSGGCWNYMNDSAASEILGYHIYVGYGLDSERHNENYKMVVRDNPLGDPEISALVYDVFCLLHSYDWAESGDTDMNDYQKDVEIFNVYELERSVPLPKQAPVLHGRSPGHPG